MDTGYYFVTNSSSGCDKNFHKGCAFKIPNNCTRFSSENTPSTPHRRESWSGRPLWIDRALHSRPHVPHTFFVHSFKKPTACHHCKKLVSYWRNACLHAGAAKSLEGDQFDLASIMIIFLCLDITS